MRTTSTIVIVVQIARNYMVCLLSSLSRLTIVCQVISKPSRVAPIMHHPFAITDSERVILLHLQIIHRLGSRDRLPARYNPKATISALHMHTNLKLASRYESLLFGQEWVLAG